MRVKNGQHSGPSGSRQHAARSRKKLEPVVAGRIVAGRNLEAARGPFGPHHNAQRGSGGHTAVDDVAALPSKKVGQCRGKQRPRGSAVAADHDRARGERGEKSRGVTHGHIGGEAAAHHPTQP